MFHEVADPFEVSIGIMSHIDEIHLDMVEEFAVDNGVKGRPDCLWNQKLANWIHFTEFLGVTSGNSTQHALDLLNAFLVTCELQFCTVDLLYDVKPSLY